MGAPALIKSWQFQVDNLVPVGASTAAEIAAQMLGVKNILKGFASNPVTVVGSSDGSTSGIDATDRWVTSANLVQNAWIVLKDAQVTSNFQFCIQLIGTGWTSNGVTPQVQITVSRSAGFGAASGGTNGNATTRPTATDEDARATINYPINTSHARRYYVWRSTDGEVTRILWRNATAGAWYGLWEWGKPRSPRALWSPACYWRFGWSSSLGQPTQIGTSAFFVTAYKSTTKVTDINCQAALPFDSGNSSTLPAAVNQVDDWEGPNDYDTFRIYMNSKSVVGAKSGMLGELYDLRTAGNVMANGTRMPDVSPFTWCSFADATTQPWLLPWNDTTPKFTAAP